jgi:hypothetical protein
MTAVSVALGGLIAMGAVCVVLLLTLRGKQGTAARRNQRLAGGDPYRGVRPPVTGGRLPEGGGWGDGGGGDGGGG